MQQPLNPRRSVPPQRRARLYGFLVGVILFAILVSIPVYLNNYAPSALTPSEPTPPDAGEPAVMTVATLTLTPTLAVLVAEPTIETLAPPTETATITPVATDTVTPEPTRAEAEPTGTISATLPLTITSGVTTTEGITSSAPLEAITATATLSPTATITPNRFILLPTPTVLVSDTLTLTVPFTESSAGITATLTVTTSTPLTD